MPQGHCLTFSKIYISLMCNNRLIISKNNTCMYQFIVILIETFVAYILDGKYNLT